MAIIKKMEEVLYLQCDLCRREWKSGTEGGNGIEVNGEQKVICNICFQQLMGTVKKPKEKSWDEMTRAERKAFKAKEKKELESVEEERLKKVKEEEGL
ncbi:MAG: hypothetical protein WC359_14865 [Dehalococcoidia bacterium]|jgi:hypothetical protein